MPYPQQRYVRATFSVHQPILQPASCAVHGVLLVASAVGILTWLNHWSAWAQGALILCAVVVCVWSLLKTRSQTIAHKIIDEALSHEVDLDIYWKNPIIDIVELDLNTESEVHVSSYWSDFQDRREATISKVSSTDYAVTLYTAGAKHTNLNAPFDSEDILICA